MIVGNEPNLNRFWLPQFNLDGTGASAAGLPVAARHDLRRRQGSGAGDDRLGRRARSARRRQAEHRPRHDLADALHPRMGRGVPGQRPHDPVHGRLRLPPVRDQLELGRRPAAARSRSPGARSTRTSSCGCSGRRSTAPRRSAPGCRSSTTSTGSSRSCRRRRRRTTPAREPATTRPVDELAQAAAYAQALRLAYCQSNVAGILLFHAADETGLQRLAVGPLLPGRDAEVVARRRARHDGRDRDGQARPVRGRDPAGHRVHAARP